MRLKHFLTVIACGFALGTSTRADELGKVFQNPPAAARPQVLWMWMGGNVSRSGITRDLEALRDAGFGGPLKSFPDWFVKGQRRPSSGRFTFTTWNCFNKNSPLVSSGQFGPVTPGASGQTHYLVEKPGE